MSIKSLFENIADAIKDKNPNVTNVTPDEMPNAIRSIPSGSSSASGVTYDNTTSGLSATNVQDAIDEVVEDVTTINSDLSELRTWTLLGTAACDTGVSLDNLPSNASELQIMTARGSLVMNNDLYVMSLAKILLTGAESDRNFYNTSWVNGDSSIRSGILYVKYIHSANKIKVVMYSGGTDVSSSSGMWIYYK